MRVVTNLIVVWRCLTPVCLALLLTIVGCRTTQSPSSSTTLWQPDTPPPSSEAYFAAQRSHAPDTNSPLALPQLLAIAIAQHPSLQRAWQSTRAAEAGARQTISAYYPQLMVSGSATWSRSDANTTFTEMDTTSYGPSAALNWLLLDYGGRRAEHEAALQTLRASNYMFNKAMHDLHLNVQKAYFTLLAAQANCEATLANVTASAKTLEAAQQKQAAGLGVELDVLQARADHEKSLYQQAGADGTLQVAGGQLATAIGMPPDTQLNIVAPTQNAPSADMATMETDLRLLVNRALQHRPDIAALHATLQASEAEVRSMRSQRFPTLNLNAKANQYWHQYSLDTLADNDTHEYLGGVSIDWLLFDGMARRQQQRIAEANREVARHKLQEAELSAGADVWSRHHLYLTARRKLAFSQSHLNSAQGAYDLAAQAYESGLKNIVDLLNAQNVLALARNELVQTEQEVWVALAELANAIGDLTQLSSDNPDE